MSNGGVDLVSIIGGITGVTALFLTWREGRRRRRLDAVYALVRQAEKVYIYGLHYINERPTITGPADLYDYDGVKVEVFNASDAPIFYFWVEWGDKRSESPAVLGPGSRWSVELIAPGSQPLYSIPRLWLYFTDSSWSQWRKNSLGGLELQATFTQEQRTSVDYHEVPLMQRVFDRLTLQPRLPYVSHERGQRTFISSVIKSLRRSGKPSDNSPER